MTPLPKPDTCRGCPLWGDGRGFVPDAIPQGARLVVVAQNPGADEERGARVAEHYGGGQYVYTADTPQPLIGVTGYHLRRSYLPLTGLREDEVGFANILRCRWERSNKLPPSPTLESAARHCLDRHLSLPSTVTHLVAHGDLAWTTLTGKGDLHNNRGYAATSTDQAIQPPRPVMATVHTAALFRQPSLKVAAIADWRRVGRWLKGEWPRPVPPLPVDVPVPPTTLARWTGPISLDTEFTYHDDIGTPYGHYPLTWIGLYHPETEEGVIYSANALFLAKGVLASLVEADPARPWLLHNALIDMAVLAQAGLPTPRWEQIEDTMLYHHLLWPEQPHTLEYLASLYGRQPRYKYLLREGVGLINTYLTGDVVETATVWQALREELRAEPALATYYRNILRPVLPHALRTMQFPIHVDQEAVERLAREGEREMEAASALATACAGYPLNLGSRLQVTRHLREIEGMTWRGKTATGRPLLDKDVVATLRGEWLPFSAEEEMHAPLTVQQALQRVEEGAHPILEALTVYTHQQQSISHYIEPLRGHRTIYPKLSLHTQAGGRLSWVEPPMAQIPPGLRALFQPPPGWGWFSFDLDQQELRIAAAAAGVGVWLQALKEGQDIHTLNACLFFGLDRPRDLKNPMADTAWVTRHNWKGKEDPRRKMAKRAVYRLLYRGDPKTMASIPGAASLGMSPSLLEAGAKRLLAQVPELTAMWDRLDRQVRLTGRVQSWAGFQRRFTTRDRGAERAASNHPMQAGGADMFKLLWRRIAEIDPDHIVLQWGAHDSFVWAIHEKIWCEAVLIEIAKVVEIPWQITPETQVVIPASYTVLAPGGQEKREWRPPWRVA